MRQSDSECSNRLRRRSFLKLLGLGLGAPLAMRFSGLLGAPQVSAQDAARPSRLFIYYLPHGWPIEFVDPGAARDDGFADSLVLGPLEPYREQVRVVRGIAMSNGATNHDAVRNVLTGFANGGGGDSIDAVIARELGLTSHVLGAVPYGERSGFSVNSRLARNGDWVRPIESPADSRMRLLGALAEPEAGVGAGSAADVEAFRRASLALTEAELQGVQTSVASLTREHDKISLHLDAIRQLQQRLDQEPPELGCEAAPATPLADATRGLNVLDQVNFGAVLDGQLEVSARALQCGAARVITLQNLWANSNVRMDFAGGPGFSKSHHDPLSHSWDPTGREEFARTQRWFYERLAAGLLAELDQPDPLDPAHTVLDNSLVYVCSEVSDGANHHSDSTPMWLNGKEQPTALPCLLIGGGAGKLGAAGWYDIPASTADILATVAAVMGVSASQLGAPSVSPVMELLS